MKRIAVKRGNTTINVTEADLSYYEARGYKKSTASAPKGRKTTTKSATDE